MQWARKEELCERVRRQTEKHDDGPGRKKTGPSRSTAPSDPCPNPDDAHGDDRRHKVQQLRMDPANKNCDCVDRRIHQPERVER